MCEYWVLSIKICGFFLSMTDIQAQHWDTLNLEPSFQMALSQSVKPTLLKIKNCIQ